MSAATRLFFGAVAVCCGVRVAGLLSAGQRRQEADLASGGLPLAWLHIPKTGSSFGNVLLHTPKICPGVPKGFAIDGAHCGYHGGVNGREVTNLPCPENNNISLKAACKGLSKWGEHFAVGDLFEKMYKGRGVAMFREPHQRMLSQYEYFLKPFGVKLKPKIPTIQGCAVKMMTRSGEYWGDTCAGGLPPTDNETEKAISRLDQFAFIGLSEKWDQSVCLFRKMFGGACVGSDFMNTRPTPPKRQREASLEGESFLGHHDVAALGGFVDKQDLKLYQAAVRKFDALCQQHGVSRRSCEPCYKNKDIAYTPDQR